MTLASPVKRLSCADNSKDLDFRNESQPKSDTPAPDLLHTFPEGPPGSNLASCSTRTSLQAAHTIKGKRPPGADATRPALWPQACQGFVMGHAPFPVIFCCAIHCHECLYTSTPIPHSQSPLCSHVCVTQAGEARLHAVYGKQGSRRLPTAQASVARPEAGRRGAKALSTTSPWWEGGVTSSYGNSDKLLSTHRSRRPGPP